LSDPDGVVADADVRGLRQILLNLLSNALKFTPPGGSVAVESRLSGDDVIITVADTGVGMGEETLGQIFTPFFQVDPTIATENVGTGLGLMISKKLAEAMGGDLAIVSALGAGATVTLRLPAVAPERVGPA